MNLLSAFLSFLLHLSQFPALSMNDLHDGSPNHDPLEDDFILALIESVQRNPCVYNRYDPLHKVTDYKHEIWKMISIEIGYDGQPVELERKWKHMRDKYVRLRKLDKQRAPIKPGNKWYNYYHKMAFLDPYVEHRNRKRQKEYLAMKNIGAVEGFDEEDLLEEVLIRDVIKREPGYESPHTSSSTSSSQIQNPIDSPSPRGVEAEKNLIMLYDKILGDRLEEKVRDSE